MKISEKDFEKDLRKLASKDKAKVLSYFFKTGPGQYGAGDIFLGVMVPQTRVVAKKYVELALPNLQKLLNSKVHEIRLGALFILVRQYEMGDEIQKKKIVNFYLKNSKNINNWDLVDLSAPKILGDYLLNWPRDILYDLVESTNLWERRIAVLATFTFIKNKDFTDALKLAKKLLDDKHDLIYKAVGWMLREVGKRDKKTLIKFLNLHYKTMPRTMLRYAIEKFDAAKRQQYLNK